MSKNSIEYIVSSIELRKRRKDKKIVFFLLSDYLTQIYTNYKFLSRESYLEKIIETENHSIPVSGIALRKREKEK